MIIFLNQKYQKGDSPKKVIEFEEIVKKIKYGINSENLIKKFKINPIK